MNEVLMLNNVEPEKILSKFVEEEVAAMMSYMSRGKWHTAKVNMASLDDKKLVVLIAPRIKPYPLNIAEGQVVGISIKHGYGKFVFESKILALGPCSRADFGGQIVLQKPANIELVQRRSYFRVPVPEKLFVEAKVWHKGSISRDGNDSWVGQLVDISAGGLQIAVLREADPRFKAGQFVGISFKPTPDSTAIMFNAQVKNILPTADERCLCLGLQIIGLEASPEGRFILQRLCGVVEQYHKMNQH